MMWWVNFKLWLAEALGLTPRVIRVPQFGYVPYLTPMTSLEWSRLASVYEREPELLAYVVSEIKAIDNKEKHLPFSESSDRARAELCVDRRRLLEILDLPTIASMMADRQERTEKARKK